tara:strand:+ start:668 stop:841 length:174 start_codon:yes stop_codon:yes gene_type:complete
MSKKKVKDFNQKLIKEIKDESILQDLFGLTMGVGENFWIFDRHDLRDIFEKVLGEKF